MMKQVSLLLLLFTLPAFADIEEEVRTAIARHADANPDFSDDTRLVDLGFDGLDVVEISMQVEQELGTDIPSQAIDKLTVFSSPIGDAGHPTDSATVGDLVRAITQASSRQSSERVANAGRIETPSVGVGRQSGTATRARPRPRPEAPQRHGGVASETVSERVGDPSRATASRAPGTATRGVPTAHPKPPSSPSTGAAEDDAYREALEAYYAAMQAKNRADEKTFSMLVAHNGWALENRRRMIERQQTAAMIVLGVVVMLVLSGVVFSGIQFYISMRHAQRNGSPPATTLKASLQSVEVSSSIMGVVILVISLLFFYLYLNRVFGLVVLPE